MILFFRIILFFISITGISIGINFIYSRSLNYYSGQKAPEWFAIVFGLCLLIIFCPLLYENLSGRIVKRLEKAWKKRR